MSWSNPLPGASQITGVNTADIALSALQAKHTDASNWATWAATLMEQQTTAIKNSIGTDIITVYLNPVLAALQSIPTYSAGNLAFTNTAFSDALLDDLRQRLIDDMAAYHTGLGNVTEQAMFDAAVARMNTERSKAYTELANGMADRGFDIPPGALSAKQTEITNETAIRLSEVNANILRETATLAADYNKAVLQFTVATVDLLGRLHNDSMMREFEIKKTSILQSLDAYRAQLGMYEVKGQLLSESAKIAIDTLQRTMTVEVEAFKGVAQSAAQMVASAINSVNMSAGFGFSGSESESTQFGLNYSLSGKMAVDGNGAGVPPVAFP